MFLKPFFSRFQIGYLGEPVKNGGSVTMYLVLITKDMVKSIQDRFMCTHICTYVYLGRKPFGLDGIYKIYTYIYTDGFI